jgi:phosphoglycerol transferase
MATVLLAPPECRQAARGSRAGAGRSLAAYTGAVLLCALFLTGLLRQGGFCWRVPFGYDRDALSVSTWIKGILDNGWYLHNGRVGAPAGLDMHDYPMTDNLHFLLIKLIGWAAGDYALTYNLFFLLTFPLTACSALWAMRRLGLSHGAALAGGLLYAFLPYHFQRAARGHLMLASYYLIPPMVVVLVWAFQGRLVRRRGLLALAIALVLPAGGVYYAFFACYFLAVAGLAAALRRGRAAPLLHAGTLIGAVVLGALLNLAPTLRYRARHGTSPAAVVRSPGEAEVLGLKVVQLLLPVTDHRLPWLAKVKARYNRACPCGTPNYPGWYDCLSLGVLGSLGFLLLLGRLCRRGGTGDRPLDALAILNVSALLLAGVGGLGMLFALLGGTEVRAYDRISIYIAFFALCAAVAPLDRLLRRRGGLGQRLLAYGTVGVALVLGVLDVTPRGGYGPPAWVAREYAGDADFVRQVEASVPAGSMIFQLPYVSFPECPDPQRMTVYNHLRAYLHSRTLRWSFGGMRGREGDLWCQRVAGLPVPEQVRALAGAGFQGVWVDRFGFADGGAALEAQLAALLGTQPLISINGRLVFYPLRPPDEAKNAS